MPTASLTECVDVGSHASVAIGVDVELLLEHPEMALFPLLHHLPGCWSTAELADVQTCALSGAMTNLVYRCALVRRGVEEAVVLARIHANRGSGTHGNDASHHEAPAAGAAAPADGACADGGGGGDAGGAPVVGCALFDRAEEVKTFAAMSSAGLGPQLLLLFGNGRLEEFLVEYVTLAAHDLPDPGVSTAIAGAMASFHCRVSDVLAGGGIEGNPPPVLVWRRLRSWHALAERLWGREALNAWLGTDGLADEIDLLELTLTSSYPVWVAVCHNDLQYGNIMALAPQAPGEVCEAQHHHHGEDNALREQREAEGQQQEEEAEAEAAAAAAGSVQQQLLSLGLNGITTTPNGAGHNEGDDMAGDTDSASPTSAGGVSPTSAAGASPPPRGRGRLVLPDGEQPRVRGQSPEGKRGHSATSRSTSRSQLMTPQQLQELQALALGGQQGDGGPDGGDADVSGDADGAASEAEASHASTSGCSSSSSPGPGPLRQSMLSPPPMSPTTLGSAAATARATAGLSGWAPAGSAGSGRAGGAVRSADVVRLIDYEYAGPAPVAFDVANHWCEWAADYHTDTPSVLDFGRMPGAVQQRAFVAAYLRGLLECLGLQAPPVEDGEDGEDGGGAWFAREEREAVAAVASAAVAAGNVSRLRSVWEWLRLHGVQRPDTAAADGGGVGVGGGGGVGGGANGAAAPPPSPVSGRSWRSLQAQLLAASRAYEAVANLQWALWGVIQSQDSVCPDFDYLDYARQKWRQYRAAREANPTA